jgi:hypothetical protein
LQIIDALISIAKSGLEGPAAGALDVQQFEDEDGNIILASSPAVHTEFFMSAQRPSASLPQALLLFLSHAARVSS